jgi:ribosomal protein S18 acetylase RimI-like enzyme
MRSYFRDERGESLFVAVRDNRIGGFLGVMAVGSSAGPVIDLIGVRPELQGQAAGSALVRACLAHYRDSGSAMRVGTQAINVPSLRLYRAFGFEVCDAVCTYHWHGAAVANSRMERCESARTT